MFALHSTDWSSRSVSATKSRFIKHDLNKIKYPLLFNKFPELRNILHYNAIYFRLMIPLNISDMLSVFQNAITLNK